MTLNLFNVKYKVKKEHLAITAMFIIMVILLITYISINHNDGIIIDTRVEEGAVGNENSRLDGAELANNEGKQEIADDLTKANEIKVYIIGCVQAPGIITLKKGQLLHEAIEAAGGLTKDADENNINMVYSLEENVMINILSKKDENNMSTGMQIIKDAGDGIKQTAGNNSNNNNNNNNTKGKININKADIAELSTLPGIGNATATAIVEYRENKGYFQKIEDIMNVPGIKDKRFEEIKNLIMAD